MKASFRFQAKRAEPSGVADHGASVDHFSPHLAVVAEALRPSMRSLLAIRSAVPPHAVRPEDDFLSFAIEQVTDLSNWFSETIPALQALHEVTTAESPTESDIRRAVSQLEQRVDTLCTRYSLVKNMRAGPRRRDGRRALLGIYEHNIQETVEWLATVIDILDDPSAEIERRGLADEEEVTLTATLSPTFPPSHLKALLSWAQQWAFDEALDELRWLLRGSSIDDDKRARKRAIDDAQAGFRTFLDILTYGIERRMGAVDTTLEESQEPQELKPLQLLEIRDAAHSLAAMSALEGFRFYLRILHGE